MERHSAPPPLRFDAITGTWSSPQGLLHDPARAGQVGSTDPVVLVGPLPSELADEEIGTSAERPTLSQRLRWALLAGVGLWVALIIVTANVTSTGSPALWTWAVAAISLAVAAFGIRRWRTARRP